MSTTTTEPPTEAKEASPSPPTTTPHYLTSSPAINYELSVTHPPIDPKIQQQIDQLRTELATHTVYSDHTFIQRYCTDTLLYKYIRARPHSHDKAKALLLETLQWRLQYRPDLILARQVEDECKSGKILVKGFDQFGRPIMIMNNDYNKTHDHDDAVRQLVFQLELASSRMTPPIEKSATHHTPQPTQHTAAQTHLRQTLTAVLGCCVCCLWYVKVLSVHQPHSPLVLQPAATQDVHGHTDNAHREIPRAPRYRHRVPASRSVQCAVEHVSTADGRADGQQDSVHQRQ